MGKFCGEAQPPVAQVQVLTQEANGQHEPRRGRPHSEAGRAPLRSHCRDGQAACALPTGLSLEEPVAFIQASGCRYSPNRERLVAMALRPITPYR